MFRIPIDLLSDYSTCCTKRVPTRSVQQLRVYTFNAPTTAYTSLHQPLVYKALTNQGGAHRYIDLVVWFNTKDSHHHPKEHIILYVFCAPGYDSLVLLNLYKH